MSELIPQEIEETPDAIRATIENGRQAALQAAQAIRDRAPRRIFLVGNGTSLYSSMAAAYTARRLVQESTPYVLAVPAGEFRYYMPALDERDIIVGVSASGEFRDVLAIFEERRNRNLCVGITHVPGSSITKAADLILMSSGGPSRVPVMTKTYASTLVAAHLLLLETFSAPPEYFSDLEAAADRSQKAIEAAKERIPAMLADFVQHEHAFYFGAGPAYAAALEGALKMKEMALLHAEGSETWEMASGPATMVNAATVCVALYVGDGSDGATAEGAAHARQWGARVLEVGQNAAAGDWHFPVPSPGVPAFASLSLVPPLALLAYRVAQQRGANPDQPSWRERYLSQGMSHILGE